MPLDSVRPQATDVGALEDVDAVVVSYSRVQLTPAHVDGHDPGRPALKQAIGESPGGRSRIQGYMSGYVDPEMLQCGVELVATPDDEAWRWPE